MMPQWMRFTITKKIALPFLLLLLLMAGLGITSLVGHRKEAASIDEMRRLLSRQTAVGRAHFALNCLLMAVNDYIITGRDSYRDAYEQCRIKLDRHLQELQTLSSSDEEAQRLHRIHAALDNVERLAEKILLLDNVRTNPRAAPLMEEMDYGPGAKAGGEVAGFLDGAERDVSRAVSGVSAQHQLAAWMVGGSSLLALGIAAAVILLTMRTIARPILELVGLAQRIAARDFAVEIEAGTRDEIGMLRAAFNAMIGEIRKRYEELERFAYVAAHDLKEPLVGIRGASEILKTDHGANLDDEGRGLVEIVGSSSGRMSALIDDLLEFARAGQVEFLKEPVSMDFVLAGVRADLGAFLKEKNATLMVQPDLPAVRCDPARFAQIWSNLLRNAAKYNDTGAPQIEVGCESVDGHHRFFVKDNGVGVEEEDQERVFMPFQRASRDSKCEGTGIGLAIVKRVVELHGGRIWLKSRAGEGTVFYFTVPK